MYCTKCGEQNNQDAKYCVKCGAEFEGNVLQEEFVNPLNHSQSEQQVVRQQIKKGKNNKLPYLIVGGIAVIAGLFFLMPHVLPQNNRPTALIYQGYEAVVESSGFDLAVKYDESSYITDTSISFKLGENLEKSFIGLSTSYDDFETEMGLGQGKAYYTNNYSDEGEVENLTSIMRDSNISRELYNSIITKGKINKTGIFDEVNQQIERLSYEANELFELPKAEVLEELFKDYLLDYASKKENEDQLFTRVAEIGKNHYQLEIYLGDLSKSVYRYLDQLEGQTAKLKKLNISERELTYLVLGAREINNEFSQEYYRDQILDFEIRSTKKAPFELLKISNRFGGMTLKLSNFNKPTVDPAQIERNIQKYD